MLLEKLLGASLYVPANHPDLTAVANGEKLAQARSIIFCTEDAVAEKDLSYALFQLSVALQNMPVITRSERFVRVRNVEVLGRVLAMPGADKLTGFVIPKASRHNMPSYLRHVRDTRHVLMPTLETADVFDDAEMRELRVFLESPGVRPRILALRIGGNDLFGLLGLRRPRNMTIYRTPLGPVIARLVTTFRPYGFCLTAPVFEHLDLPDLLAQEVEEDLAHGMIGKTAIHPDQIAQIERHFMVMPGDLASAEAILAADSPAVFKLDNSMCEVTTHRAWAQRTIAQASHFGAYPTVDPANPVGK